MLTNHAGELLARVRAARENALAAMGETATALVRAQMRSGYAQPVVETGALMADVQWQTLGEDSVAVGNTLPYARPVHDGTAHMPARPYLADALSAGTAQLMDAAARSLAEV